MPETVYFDEYFQTSPNLEDKVVAITGTSSGCGFEAAKFCVKKNVKVLFLLNRESSVLREAIGELKEEESSTRIVSVNCDLSSFKSVQEAAKEVNDYLRESNDSLDVLMNNAGVCFLTNQLTEDGFDITMQVNFLSHALLTNLLLNSLLESPSARIVFQSSVTRFTTKFKKNGLKNCKKLTKEQKEELIGTNSSKDIADRYGNSKICTAIFCLELGRRFPSLTCCVADPGVSATKITKSAEKNNAPNSISRFFDELSTSIFFPPVMQSAADGCLTLVEASFGENIKSGDFIAPNYVAFGKPKIFSNYGKQKPGFMKTSN
eukprot:snap_masked-scaffold_44-processed-gene-1.2-mRNA-1 protein AED:1.00 eAED:1.00 QI:0/0/0/0/1/1/2/0/318